MKNNFNYRFKKSPLHRPNTQRFHFERKSNWQTYELTFRCKLKKYATTFFFGRRHRVVGCLLRWWFSIAVHSIWCFARCWIRWFNTLWNLVDDELKLLWANIKCAFNESTIKQSVGVYLSTGKRTRIVIVSNMFYEKYFIFIFFNLFSNNDFHARHISHFQVNARQHTEIGWWPTGSTCDWWSRCSAIGLFHGLMDVILLAESEKTSQNCGRYNFLDDCWFASYQELPRVVH